ncbi:phosphatidylinositol 3-kinase catalytic subunit type 3 [Anaeramoeba ignava]|uniref:phosphatidylinositol 3-kinase n=1 Tax=Anaeramoeba ignava TaxID=1746090 RepID=A0A9Q0LHD9_ANAIG|nr:phosphatidylinositol 3-kinase catalytic subunit type 3 [Anaeramoeba ignava]|eukprot:Anaeramoba_ignava/a480033_32.p1 GENE.a480033_32~~a480033_32.p1  ORF type:complete len:969 (-),score=320.19 a480033_32:24-2930(-)
MKPQFPKKHFERNFKPFPKPKFPKFQNPKNSVSKNFEPPKKTVETQPIRKQNPRRNNRKQKEKEKRKDITDYQFNNLLMNKEIEDEVYVYLCFDYFVYDEMLISIKSQENNLKANTTESNDSLPLPKIPPRPGSQIFSSFFLRKSQKKKRSSTSIQILNINSQSKHIQTAFPDEVVDARKKLNILRKGSSQLNEKQQLIAIKILEISSTFPEPVIPPKATKPLAILSEFISKKQSNTQNPRIQSKKEEIILKEQDQLSKKSSNQEQEDHEIKKPKVISSPKKIPAKNISSSVRLPKSDSIHQGSPEQKVEREIENQEEEKEIKKQNESKITNHFIKRKNFDRHAISIQNKHNFQRKTEDLLSPDYMRSLENIVSETYALKIKQNQSLDPNAMNRKFNYKPKKKKNKSVLKDQADIIMQEISIKKDLDTKKTPRLNTNEKFIPTFEEYKKLNKIIERPPLQELTEEEKDMIWKFRNTLRVNSRALPKFILSLNLDVEFERQEMIRLVNDWKIDIVAILELLSKNFIDEYIREFATNQMRKYDDDELLLYLLQIVQGMRYEKSEKSALVQFLIERALNNKIFGTFFYWYIFSERNDHDYSIFGKVLLEFARQCLETPKNKKHLLRLRRHEELVNSLKHISEAIRTNKDPRPKKITHLRENFPKDHLDLVTFEKMPLPLDPSVFITGIVPESIYIFKSALCPLKITFKTINEKDYSIIFKAGDDLRQDNLVMQLILLMDRLLKQENLDLKLTPYKVLPTSADVGMIQYIDSKSLSSILSDHHNKIADYLIKNNPDPETEYGFTPLVMDNYIKSCAGYGVITYLLGVGDRHLDNLLLTPDGKLFHIDFGYIFGSDPKPFPPPMKLCKEMIDAMMGRKSTHYNYFKLLSGEAFNVLRKSAYLILDLLSLMIDANITDFQKNPDAIPIIYEKFRLDLNDNDAAQYICSVIDESVNALFPQVVETLHKWAQYWRS